MTKRTLAMPRAISPAALTALAAGALALAAIASLVTLVRAVRIAEPAAVRAADVVLVPRAELPVRQPASSLRAALDDDPFSIDRARPAQRYRLPGAEVEQPPAAPEPSVPAVLGTVIGAGGDSFAACAVKGGQPKHVRVGDSVGGYVVHTIERGRVVFTAPSGKQVEVRTSRVRN